MLLWGSTMSFMLRHEWYMLVVCTEGSNAAELYKKHSSANCSAQQR